jgi:hypothetical protein
MDEIAKVASSLHDFREKYDNDQAAMFDLLREQNKRVQKLELWQATIKGAGMAIRGMWVVGMGLIGVAGGALVTLITQVAK